MAPVIIRLTAAIFLLYGAAFALAPEALATLDEQLWRRLGVTQTFDRLLVVAGPCSIHDPEAAIDYAGVRDYLAGGTMSGSSASSVLERHSLR